MDYMELFREKMEEIFKTNQEIPPVINIDDLTNQKDRTLLYGYTCERDSWHVYIKNHKIYTIFYSFNGKIQEVEVKRNKTGTTSSCG